MRTHMRTHIHTRIHMHTHTYTHLISKGIIYADGIPIVGVRWFATELDSLFVSNHSLYIVSVSEWVSEWEWVCWRAQRDTGEEEEGGVHVRANEWMNEWMNNQWVNKWMNGWMNNQWVNEWINKWMNDSHRIVSHTDTLCESDAQQLFTYWPKTFTRGW